MKKQLLVFLFLIFISNIVLSQGNFNIYKFNPRTQNIKQYLPPLGVLIDSAIKNNPRIKFWQADIEVGQSNIRSARRQWTRHIGISSDIRYGNYDNLSMGGTAGTTPVPIYYSKQETRYGVGMFMKYPFFDLLNRRSDIKLAEYEKLQATYNKQNEINNVREEVIIQFNNLLLKQKKLTIQTSYMETSNLNLMMAERKFKNGLIQLTEMARLTEINSRSKLAFEDAKTDFVVSFLILQEIVGFKF